MIKAIGNEIKRLQKNSKIKILSSIDVPTKKDYSSHEKIVVYRIFQEVINNCLKHAKASEIQITLSTTPHFKMTISDNGKGFDFDKIKKNRLTMGLQNMQSRAAFINFILEIHTQLGEGTTIILSEKN
jgi:signal transduction histidine kinase